MEVSFVHQLTDSERRYGYGDPIKSPQLKVSREVTQGFNQSAREILDLTLSNYEVV